MSGVALRHVRVDRAFQLALDEARDHAVCYGIVDEREEVVNHWRDARSWMVAPVVVNMNGARQPKHNFRKRTER